MQLEIVHLEVLTNIERRDLDPAKRGEMALHHFGRNGSELQFFKKAAEFRPVRKLRVHPKVNVLDFTQPSHPPPAQWSRANFNQHQVSFRRIKLIRQSGALSTAKAD